MADDNKEFLKIITTIIILSIFAIQYLLLIGNFLTKQYSKKDVVNIVIPIYGFGYQLHKQYLTLPD
jgi:Na+/citrate or Na+/malate symporter